MLLRLVQPDTEGISFFSFTAILIASIWGTLEPVLLSVSVVVFRRKAL
ncbi:MAG: hypothetical protein ACOC2D_13655 [Spirochaetota bacterium]